MKYDFFITYHYDDEMAARWIAAVLKEERLSTLLESWEFLPGDTAEEKLHHTLTVCKGVIVLISYGFLQSGFTPETAQKILKKFSTGEKKSFIPVHIRPCDVTGDWGSISVIDLVGAKEEEARKRLIDAVWGGFKKFQVQNLRMTGDQILKQMEKDNKELLTKTIKHNYHMKLNLEQEVEKVVEIKNERTGEIEKRKERVWERVELETVLGDRNDYILVNPSGMGKTTFLTYLTCALLDQQKNYPFVPLFTTCIALNNREGSITTFITEQLELYYDNTETYLIGKEWKNLCLLIDALDQAKDVDDIVSSIQLQDKINNYKKAKIILSSRQNTADRVKEGFRKIRLQLPTENEILQYLGVENYRKLETLIKSSRELIAVPVLLEMLKTIAEKGHISSKLVNRSGLYTEFTRILIDQERRKPRFWENASFIRHFIYSELEEVLEKIAFFPLVDNEILEIDKNKISKYCESVKKKEALLNIGIILEFFEDREQKMVFRHQSFQAYFAARYIYKRQPEIFHTLTGDIRFFYSDIWYEVMRFYVGLEKDQEKAGDIIKSILPKNRNEKFFGDPKHEFSENTTCRRRQSSKVNLNDALRLIFAVFLMSEVKVSIKQVRNLHKQLRVLLSNSDEYRNFFISNSDKFNKENNEQRRNLFNTLVHLLRDKNRHVYITAAEAFAKIGTVQDIHFLQPLLSDKDSSVRSIAVAILGKIGTPREFSLLQPLLRDKNVDVRCAATVAMGKIGTVKHIPLLASLLRDKDWNVRRHAAATFWKIGTEKDIPLLDHMREVEDEEVYLSSAEILEEISIIEDNHFLESMLWDKDFIHLRKNAAVLLKIVKEKNIPLLKSMLRDNNNFIQNSAATELCKIFTIGDIPLLKSMISDNEWFIRRFSADALGKIGTSDHVPILESLLSDEFAAVRKAAVETLGKIGTSDHVHLLAPLLRDKDFNVRCAAIETLGKIGSDKNFTLIESFLKDKECWVRSSTIEVLGRFVTAKYIPLLKSLIKDEDSFVRSATAEALGKIGTVKILPLLEPLLSDEDYLVRWTAAEVLGKIGTPDHIFQLEPLLRDGDKNVRNAATEAIEQIYRRSIPTFTLDITPQTRKTKVVQPQFMSPPPTSPLYILHISDIHYGLENDPSITRIFHEFIQDIKTWRGEKKNRQIHAICLTGDIAQSGQKKQYEAIKEKIDKILEATGCSKDNLFIIPGNHDVWEYDKISPKGETTLEEVRENKMDIDTGVLSSFDNYRDFYEKFNHYYGFVENSGYVNSVPEKDNGNPKPWYSRPLEDCPIRVIGLNSALFGIKEFHEYGKIQMGTNQFTEAYFQGKTENPTNGELVIMLTHHPLNWLSKTEYDKFSTLLERYSVIHLHGHIHQSKFLRKQGLFSPSGNSYLSVGTGSLYGAKGTEDINTYHILTFDFEKKEIHIWVRRWIPELGRWSVYADESNNTFPFPRSSVKTSRN